MLGLLLPGLVSAARTVRILRHRGKLALLSQAALSSTHTPGQGILDDLFPTGARHQTHPDLPDLDPELLQGDGAPYRTFRSLIEFKREQAKRSLLVQVRSVASAEDLFQYCSGNLGRVKEMHFHHNPENKNFSVSANCSKQGKGYGEVN